MTAQLDLSLRSRPMLAVLAAQFLSAFGDNALLIAAIGLAKAHAHGNWIPLLQASFVIPFILLAPFLGALADAHPKGWVMLLANGLKLIAAVAMIAGFNPLLCYGLAGLGAAAYSPAKYGILTQMFAAEKLVKANGLLEGSTIVAILLGVLAGGRLADRDLNQAFIAIIIVYALAAVINLFIPKLPPERPLQEFDFMGLLREFFTGLQALMRDTDARFSLLGTSLFWGTGSTLRLLLFSWVPVALHLAGNQMPANLMGALSIGIVLGAVLAGSLVKLERVERALLGGLLLGPLILVLAQQTDLIVAVLLLVAIGAAGGYFVVPLNALLQERGHHSIGAGRALAVQNLWENLSMLGFVAVYAAMESLPVVPVAMGFGVVVLTGVAALAWSRRSAGS